MCICLYRVIYLFLKNTNYFFITKLLESLSIPKSLLGGNLKERGESPECGCLQGCMETEYDAETTHALYNLNIFAANHPGINKQRYVVPRLIRKESLKILMKPFAIRFNLLHEIITTTEEFNKMPFEQRYN